MQEIARAGDDVNDLVVHNPLELPVLLYEGEEVHGAQQNRTVDVSVLVPPPTSTLRVPVSCVEQGRWDHRRHAEPFAPAPQTAYPELRRLKNEQRARAARGRRRAARRPGPGVAGDRAKSARHGARSDTGALHDVFEHRRDMIDRVRAEIEMKCSQVGMLAAIGGRFVVLDYVSDVEAFAALQDRSSPATRWTRIEPTRSTAARPRSRTRATSSPCCSAPPRDTAPAIGLGTRRCASTSARSAEPRSLAATNW